MKHFWILGLLVACDHDHDHETTPATPSASVAAVSKPAPKPKASAKPKEEEPKAPKWNPVHGGGDLDWLPGTWISTETGDAIPKGPTGGKIVKGGVRVKFAHKRLGSKTPWNITFWAPKDGHMKSETIGGGCGLYPPEPGEEEWSAYCRGYGLETPDKAHITSAKLTLGSDNVLWLVVEGVLDDKLTQVE
jgi:hypothetical protein